MAYCAYLRKSRADAEAEAKGAGETLARHEAELIHLAARLNINLTAVYKEVVSGETIASRPKMQQLLAEVESGKWQGVLVVEITRLARGDTIDQGIVAQAFKYSGTKIITPAKIYDPANEIDEEYFEFGLFMSRREYKMINQRQQRGRLAAIQEGKFVGNKAPYGYRRIKLERQKGWSLEPDDNAETVQLIFDLFTKERLGCSKIRRRLNDLHIPTVTGKPWTDCVIRGIITNPAYAGWVRWGYRPTQKKPQDGVIKKSRPRAANENITLIHGLHQPIISQEQFNTAQEILLANRSTRERCDLGLQNPLAGVITCSCCGNTMTRRPGANDGHTSTMLMCYTQGCPTVGSVLTKVEAALLDSLQQWLHNYRVSAGMPEEQDDTADILHKSAAALQKELDTTKQQMSRIHQLLEQDIYSIEVFLKRSAEVTAQQEELQSKLEGIQKEIAAKENAAKASAILIPRIQSVLDAYPTAASPEDKNRLLKSVLKKVDYYKTTRCKRNDPADNLRLIIYPRQPEDM